jgi:hypothetical protein
MPDVGLLNFSEPVPPDNKVVVKYSVEVNGLPVYSESYDIDTVAEELKQDEPSVLANWIRRITCVVACRHRHGFSACLTRCLADGKACAKGHEDCRPV